MIKYCIFIIFGIILYLLWNTKNCFSIGAPVPLSTNENTGICMWVVRYYPARELIEDGEPLDSPRAGFNIFMTGEDASDQALAFFGSELNGDSIDGEGRRINWIGGHGGREGEPLYYMHLYLGEVIPEWNQLDTAADDASDHDHLYYYYQVIARNPNEAITFLNYYLETHNFGENYGPRYPTLGDGFVEQRVINDRIALRNDHMLALTDTLTTAPDYREFVNPPFVNVRVQITIPSALTAFIHFINRGNPLQYGGNPFAQLILPDGLQDTDYGIIERIDTLDRATMRQRGGGLLNQWLDPRQGLADNIVFATIRAYRKHNNDTLRYALSTLAFVYAMETTTEITIPRDLQEMVLERAQNMYYRVFYNQYNTFTIPLAFLIPAQNLDNITLINQPLQQDLNIEAITAIQAYNFPTPTEITPLITQLATTAGGAGGEGAIVLATPTPPTFLLPYNITINYNRDLINLDILANDRTRLFNQRAIPGGPSGIQELFEAQPAAATMTLQQLVVQNPLNLLSLLQQEQNAEAVELQHLQRDEDMPVGGGGGGGGGEFVDPNFAALHDTDLGVHDRDDVDDPNPQPTTRRRCAAKGDRF
jgi:hypothetical protein